MKIGNFEISKKLFITLIIVLILAITAFTVKELYVKRYEKYKVSKDDDFIYTKVNYETTDTKIPYININSTDAQELNKKLQSLALIYASGTLDDLSLTYEYNISSNYVSLLLISRGITEDKTNYKFDSYIFDLKQAGKLISNDDVIKLFNKNENDINNKIEEEMTKKYNYEIKESILPKTCDYTCFLKLRNITSYIDGVRYFIENGNLVAYKAYDVYSEYGEEDYYTRDDFKFYIN